MGPPAAVVAVVAAVAVLIGPIGLSELIGVEGKGSMSVTPTVSVGGPAATSARTRSAVAASLSGRVMEIASTRWA